MASHNRYTSKHPIHSPAFTLIEVLVVVAIMAILAAVSYAMYSSYFKMAFESEAMSVFEQVRMAQTQHMAEHNTYACNINSLPKFQDANPGDGIYTLNAGQSGKRRFTLTANCTNANATYHLSIENHPSDTDMKIKWTMSCGQGQPTPCQPAQIQGTGGLSNIF